MVTIQDVILHSAQVNLEGLKSKQNNKIWMEDIDGMYSDLEKAFNVYCQLPGVAIGNEEFEDIFENVKKILRSDNIILLGSKPNESISYSQEEFDPLDSTWLDKETREELGFENDVFFYGKKDIVTRWGRYLKYLYIEKRFSLDTVKSIGSSSMQILARCGNPTIHTDFFYKGMVVGSVQSGKTTNFNAVVNGAYDVGYDLVIVLTGITEVLRKQTQERLNEDLGIGDGRIGVKKINCSVNKNFEGDIFSLTSSNRDFDKSTLLDNQNLGGQKSLIVAKKNNSSLFNICKFIENKIALNKIDIDNFNLLIVDDEADNATLNALGAEGDDNEASTINGLIRAILGFFKRKTYLAYTATPFANILQDDLGIGEWEYRGEKFYIEANLYPEHFVRLLYPPINYIGPKYFFGNNEEFSNPFYFLIEKVSDYNIHFPERLDKITLDFIELAKNEKSFENNESLVKRYSKYATYRSNTRAPKKDDANLIVSLPRTLKDAILSFIITIAVRDLRASTNDDYYKRQVNNTMLIHFSRFSSWQNQLKKLLKNDDGNGYFDEVLIKLNTDYVGEGIYKDFERVWINYFEGIVGNLNGIMESYYHDEFIQKNTFNEIVKGLAHAAKKIDILSANTSSDDEVEYNEIPKCLIVIGGNKLSRGFTLEGLSISYFTRTTNYADAILQMGRWFGYRPGFLDCCKLFADQDSINKFHECNDLLYELEKDIEQHMNGFISPSEVVNRIKSSTGSLLQITRPSILKNAKKAFFTFSDKLIQTTKFDLDNKKHENSFENFLSFIKKYREDITLVKNERAYLLKNRSFDIVKELINTSEIVNDSFDKERIYQFIDNIILKEGYLKQWDVFFIKKGDGEKEICIEGLEINTVVRSGPSKYAYKRNGDIVSKKPNKMYTRLLEDKFYNIKKNNIISPADMGLGLSDAVLNSFTSEDRKKESTYRQAYEKERGVLLVYLIDTNKVVNVKGAIQGEVNSILKLNTEIPIVGFALGITNLEIEPQQFYFVEKEIKEIELNED